jgi:hypothetical protein
MFRTRLVPAGVVFGLAVSLGSVARADDTPVDFLAQALGNVGDVVRTISDKTSFGYDGGVAILGAYVRSGQTVKLNRWLEANESYAFLGHGDRDTLDVDIELQDLDGNRIASDSRSQTLALVEFKPKQAGKYTIALKLSKCQQSWSFCAMAILKDHGWKVPDKNLVDAAGGCLRQCNKVAQVFGRIRFIEEPNQWTLFGGVVEQGDDISLGNMTLGSGQRRFVGAADSHAQDIDLFLTPNESQWILGKDDRDDALPTFAYPTHGQGRYDLHLKNARSNGASIMFAAVLAQ